MLSDAAFLEARAGRYYKDFIIYSRAPQQPLYNDTATTERFGGDRQTHTAEYRPQMNGSLSFFKSGWGNSHNLKFGWEIAYYPTPGNQPGRISRADKDLEDLAPNDNRVQGLPPDVEHRLINGAPSEVVLFETPNKTKNFQWTYSAYVNDAWQLNDHLSFNLGIRFDRYRNGYPDQVHPVGRFNATEVRFPANPDVFHFNTVGPRLGIVWNIKGNGKTLVKANWGQYAWRVSGNVAGQNPNPLAWSKRYVWNDRNGDRLWQRGEEGRLVAATGGSTNERIDPNWKNNVTSELAAWLERELIPNFGVRSGVIWRGDKNKQVVLNPNRPFEAYNIPITVRDPGPDGVVGNADDGPSFTAWNLETAALNAPIVNLTTHNPYLTDGEDHYTWEIAGTKRMSNHWSMNTSFAHTWSREAVNGTNPNAFIGTESDQRKHYTNWQAKLAGTFQLPYEVNISPVIRHQSGDPFGRTIQARLNYGTQTIQVEPESARRVTNVTIVDVRAEKGIRVGGRRVAFFFDLFNILNANADQAIVQSSGSTFLRPTVIVPPRVARIGAKFEW
ncbi:MAG: TonB-dependent receptor [Acidobacteria bacterium]|nr:TonB-dependent receptor [Acidobacteriota bacterium]